MKKSNIVFLLFAFLFLSASQCQKNASGTQITGTMKGAENLNVYFDQTGIDDVNTVLLQTQANGSGEYSFEFPEGLEAGSYRVRFGAKSAKLILDGSEKVVEMDGDLNSLRNYGIEVKGSSTSEEFVNAMQSYIGKQMQMADIQNFVKSADPLVGMEFAMTTLGNRPDFATIHSDVSKRMDEAYPGSEASQVYSTFAANLTKQLALRNAQSKIKIGEVAPDISLPNPDGKDMALSDLRGQVVLLDFWASWCGPCRKANPKVVQTYKKYKDQGFTVYSVSLDGLDARTKKRFKSDDQIQKQLDSSMQRWKAAIAKDQLEWDSHVSDLKKWDSAPAAAYGVRSIPKTFLIDRDGKIAALNPRYNLEEELLKIL